MKLLIAIVLIGVLAPVILASPRWKKRSILAFDDAFNNNSTTGENNTVSKPDCVPLNDTQAKAMLVAFGVLENPGVTLVNNVSGDLLNTLRANGTVTFVLGKRRKRDVSRKLCPEEKIVTMTPANKGGFLFYRIYGTRCAKAINGVREQPCYVRFGGLRFGIGICTAKAGKMVLQAISKCGDVIYKKITFICSCNCVPDFNRKRD